MAAKQTPHVHQSILLWTKKKSSHTESPSKRSQASKQKVKNYTVPSSTLVSGRSSGGGGTDWDGYGDKDYKNRPNFQPEISNNTPQSVATHRLPGGKYIFSSPFSAFPPDALHSGAGKTRWIGKGEDIWGGTVVKKNFGQYFVGFVLFFFFTRPPLPSLLQIFLFCFWFHHFAAF